VSALKRFDALWQSRIAVALGCLSLLALAACGGGADHSGMDGGSTPPPRGSLVQNPPQLLQTLTAVQLASKLTGIPGQQLLALSGLPVCDILVYHLEYTTVGGAAEATTASGALLVPVGTDASCHGSRPILLYAHGTTTDRAFNIADLNNPQNVEGLSLAAFFAARGYIVVAPNYAGYDISPLPYHPYLVADQQSGEMIDSLAAARSALTLAGAFVTQDSGQLYITGYSQGGYVAMATQRAMQASGMTAVTASAPMSGPYALAAFVDAVFEGQVNSSGPVDTAFLFTAYQRTYGNFYSSAAEVFSAQYAPGIESLLPSATPRSQLYAEGKLPEFALFSSSPPAPAYANMTPATMPPNLASVFALGFGNGNLVTNGFRLLYLVDAGQHPDGGSLPTSTAALPARQILAGNDLRGFVPTAPTLLCGGDADPTVFFFNTQLVAAHWATQAPLSQVLDVDAAVTPGDPHATLKQEFQAAKIAVAVAAILNGATDGGASAVANAYHGTLVAPFCLAAVKDFFATH
jgi:poly(3-hydroxybutyrate) depolymerase